MTAQVALEQLVMLPQAECPTQLIPVGLQSCTALGEIKRAQPGKKCQNIRNSDIRQVQIKRWKSVVIFISRRQQSQCCFLSIAQRSTKKLVLLLWVIGSSSFPAGGYGQDSPRGPHIQHEFRNLVLVPNKADIVRASGNTTAECQIPSNAHLQCSTWLPVFQFKLIAWWKEA